MDEPCEPSAGGIDEADFGILHAAVTGDEIVSGDGAIVDEGLLDIVEENFFREGADFADIAGERGAIVDEILYFGDVDFAEFAGIGEGLEGRGERDEESAVWEGAAEVMDGGVEGEGGEAEGDKVCLFEGDICVDLPQVGEGGGMGFLREEEGVIGEGDPVEGIGIDMEFRGAG